MDRARRPGVITLARHGRPDADRTVRLCADGYRRWWAAYDTLGLRPGDPVPPAVMAAAADADIIFCSGLPRALETAHAAAPGREIRIDPRFIEAPLPPPLLPRFWQMRPPAWGVLSRLAWWCGHAPAVESRADAERRAESAADILVDAAQHGSNVMLFAHGWFNRMLRPALRRRMYRCVRDGGDAYWSFRVYQPRIVAPAASADRLPAQNRDG